MNLIYWVLTVTMIAGVTTEQYLYQDVAIVDTIDRLITGFDVYPTKSLLSKYITRNGSVIESYIYTTIVPLSQGYSEHTAPPAQMDFGFSESFLSSGNTLIKLPQNGKLDEQSWYIVCIEFTSKHIQHSTTQYQMYMGSSCHLQRTRGTDGIDTLSAVENVKVRTISNSHVEISIEVNVNYPLQLTTYLEHGSTPLQIFYISKPRTITIIFDEMTSGFNYGRIFTVERPLRHAYTALGRAIDVSLTTSHHENVKTRFDDNSDPNSKKRNIESDKKAQYDAYTDASHGTSFGNILATSSWFNLMYIYIMMW